MSVADTHIPLYLSLCSKFELNVCGEGGEYETLTLDSPVFTKARIILDATKVCASLRPTAHIYPRRKILSQSGKITRIAHLHVYAAALSIGL
eukprot:scaffold377684_cov21-Prasinocladus_malaysianus.AAC.1